MSLVLRGLTRSYGGRVALRPTDLEIEKGTAHMLLGPNGSGKSTLLLLVAGLRIPTAGSCTWQGTSTGRPAGRATMAAVLERPAFPGHLTAGELAGATCPELGVDPSQRFGTMSAGQRQRAAIAVALARQPRLLLLDEPLTALDGSGVRTVTNAVATRVRSGTTVLLATHRPADWTSVATHVVAVREGAVRPLGSIDAVTAGLEQRPVADWSPLTTGTS